MKNETNFTQQVHLLLKNIKRTVWDKKKSTTLCSDHTRISPKIYWSITEYDVISATYMCFNCRPYYVLRSVLFLHLLCAGLLPITAVRNNIKLLMINIYWTVSLSYAHAIWCTMIQHSNVTHEKNAWVMFGLAITSLKTGAVTGDNTSRFSAHTYIRVGP